MLAYRMMYHINIFCTMIELGIVNKSNDAMVVGKETCCLVGLIAQICEKLQVSDHIFSCKFDYYIFGFDSRGSNINVLISC